MANLFERLAARAAAARANAPGNPRTNSSGGTKAAQLAAAQLGPAHHLRARYLSQRTKPHPGSDEHAQIDRDSGKARLAHSTQGAPVRPEKVADHDRRLSKLSQTVAAAVLGLGLTGYSARRKTYASRVQLRRGLAGQQSGRYSVFAHQFVEPARRCCRARRRRGPYGCWGLRCGTAFGFGSAPTRRIPCLPLSSRTAGARANHCPVASQTTAKTATSDGSSTMSSKWRGCA